jgi:hypothetical protein
LNTSMGVDYNIGVVFTVCVNDGISLDCLKR